MDTLVMERKTRGKESNLCETWTNGQLTRNLGHKSNRHLPGILRISSCIRLLFHTIPVAGPGERFSTEQHETFVVSAER